ncbi:heme-binding protein [Candidatus Dependentiae bacterium]|nr:heme-binding protein [Candidatus Dependentiae bacterium]
MVTNIANLSLNVVRKMADAAEVEARKLGVEIGIAVVAADSSIFFSRCMDNVNAMRSRDAMKKAMAVLEHKEQNDVVFIANAKETLGVIAIEGVDTLSSQRCIQAALSVIEA